MIARAGNYSTASGVSLAQDCYIGRVNYKTAKCEIVARKSNTDTVLAEADIPPTANSTGVRHTARFVCTGSSPATLQFYIDGNLAANVGDNTTTIITSGDSGLQAGNGTVYVDNFAVLAYSSSTGGAPAYTGATPDEFLDSTPSDSATFMRLWMAGDYELTKDSFNYVTGWQDKAEFGGTTYTLSDGQTTNRAEVLPAALNGRDVVRLDHTKSTLLKGDRDQDRLNINGSSYGGGFNVFYVLRFYKNTIGDQQNVSDTTNIAPVINYGRSWQTRLKWRPADESNYNRQHQFDNNSSFPVTPATGAPQFTVGDWVILSYNASTGGSAGFYKNGVNQSTGNSQTSNFDMTDTNAKLYIGRRQYNVTDEDYMYGSFDIAEILLVEAPQNTGVTTANRQKIEGYLAWKWGLEANLPSDHPYKSAPPSS